MEAKNITEESLNTAEELKLKDLSATEGAPSEKKNKKKKKEKTKKEKNDDKFKEKNEETETDFL